ncbi:hypothetical protein HPP92_021656 [Vanilla planifolia]|uniref:Transmembrane 9 superfamily member n=1 Tax=Vanilla planifolia TaxID=51239 RepID=A0A835PWZ7_VANPL|nr:hypothetical protein HPP92_021656 [Vanilla planifolia]
MQLPARRRVYQEPKAAREVSDQDPVRADHCEHGVERENSRWCSPMRSPFVESDIRWPSRTVRRDLTRYEELDKEAQAQMNEELSGLKLVVSDVFRAPSNPTLLCVMVGDGVQILGMAVVTILFAALLIHVSASRGALVTGMLFIYLVLELQLVTQQFGFGRPSRAKAPHIDFPVRTNQIPREIPPQKHPSWLLVLGAGRCHLDKEVKPMITFEDCWDSYRRVMPL